MCESWYNDIISNSILTIPEVYYLGPSLRLKRLDTPVFVNFVINQRRILYHIFIRNFAYIVTFLLVWILNRLISAGLEPVLSHTGKIMYSIV